MKRYVGCLQDFFTLLLALSLCISSLHAQEAPTSGGAGGGGTPGATIGNSGTGTGLSWNQDEFNRGYADASAATTGIGLGSFASIAGLGYGAYRALTGGGSGATTDATRGNAGGNTSGTGTPNYSDPNYTVNDYIRDHGQDLGFGSNDINALTPEQRELAAAMLGELKGEDPAGGFNANTLASPTPTPGTENETGSAFPTVTQPVINPTTNPIFKPQNVNQFVAATTQNPPTAPVNGIVGTGGAPQGGESNRISGNPSEIAGHPLSTKDVPQGSSFWLAAQQTAQQLQQVLTSGAAAVAALVSPGNSTNAQNLVTTAHQIDQAIHGIGDPANNRALREAVALSGETGNQVQMSRMGGELTINMPDGVKGSRTVYGEGIFGVQQVAEAGGRPAVGRDTPAIVPAERLQQNPDVIHL